MNIKTLDIKTIEELSLRYNMAVNFKFGESIKTQNAKKQKKIRKWIYKHCLNNNDFSNEIKERIKKLSDSEFISFLKSCYDYIKSNGTALEQRINKVCEEFPNDVKKSFLTIFENEQYVKNDFKKSNNNVEIFVQSFSSYEEKLILLDAEFSTENFDLIYFYDNCSFVKEEGIYKIIAKGDLYEEDEEFDVTISFSSAKTEIEVFNPINDSLSTPPWEQLFNISNAIIYKEDLNCHLNSLELELLPLLKEIENIFLFNSDDKSFPILKDLIKKHKFFELLPLLEKIESDDFSTNRRMYLASKLTNKLNFIKYKPLWQEIYNLICKSQQEYPTYIETKKPKATITKLKNKVTALMNEYGYFGEYPLFYKKSSIKGIHTIDSYNTSYTIISHKNAVHYIICEENYDVQNGIYLTFSYGTELLKRNEDMSDFHSCRFNCKGKKFASFIMFNADFNEEESLSLEERIKIAVKTVEFKKLNKVERSKTFNSFSTFGAKIITFLLVFLFGGFFFASLFIPAMMGFSALMLWLDGMPVVINDIPWLVLYFQTWILFGGPFGIATVFSKK